MNNDNMREKQLMDNGNNKGEHTKEKTTKGRLFGKVLLTYQVIAAAASGDVDAINAVLKHYEGYIATLSTRTAYDAAGTLRFYVDEEMRRRLETKLITKILAFRVA